MVTNSELSTQFPEHVTTDVDGQTDGFDVTTNQGLINATKGIFRVGAKQQFENFFV